MLEGEGVSESTRSSWFGSLKIKGPIGIEGVSELLGYIDGSKFAAVEIQFLANASKEAFAIDRVAHFL